MFQNRINRGNYIKGIIFATIIPLALLGVAWLTTSNDYALVFLGGPLLIIYLPILLFLLFSTFSLNKETP